MHRDSNLKNVSVRLELLNEKTSVMKSVQSKHSYKYEPSPDVLSEANMINSRREDTRLEIKKHSVVLLR